MFFHLSFEALGQGKCGSEEERQPEEAAGMLPQRDRVGADGEAEEKKRRRSEREDAHDLDATSPLEEEVLAKGDEEISQAPSANPAPSAPAGSGMSAVAPANTRRPASRTKPRSQSARPRSRRCVAMSTVAP